MLKDNQEYLSKLRANRQVQLLKAPAKQIKPITRKESEKAESQDAKESSSTPKANVKDDKKAGKADKEKTNAKGSTKHSEMNGHTPNSKLKHSLSLKRKLSTV